MSEIVLLGNNLAILVAATKLIQSGRRVTVLTDGKTLGGHFAGLQIAEHVFDIGMVLLEQHIPTHFEPKTSSYNPDRRNDWTRFGNLAAEWISEQVEMVRAPTPECMLNDQVWPDYLMTNRLEVFEQAQFPPPKRILRSDARHAFNKNEAGPYDTLTYAEAAELNHGWSLHKQSIEPFIRKVMGVGSKGFLARYHRAAWAPLFYPETLNKAITGSLPDISEYPFWATAQGHTGQIVKRAYSTLVASPKATIITSEITQIKREKEKWKIFFDDDKVCNTERLTFGISVERANELMQLTPPEPQASAAVTLMFALVDAKRIGRTIGCLMVVDEKFATFRITDQDAIANRSTDWHRISIEANPDQLSRLYPELEPKQALEIELTNLLQISDANAICSLRTITAKHAITIPTQTAVAAGVKNREALLNATFGSSLTGALLGYGVASMNDQIVQGITLSEEYT